MPLGAYRPRTFASADSRKGGVLQAGRNGENRSDAAMKKVERAGRHEECGLIMTRAYPVEGIVNKLCETTDSLCSARVPQ
jgi:hypothetical protein